MDNLTHSLAGFALARAGLGRASPGATLALVIASNLPDIDLVSRLGGTAQYLEQHRGLSHSVVGAPLLALLLTVILHRTVAGARFWPLLLCSLGGVVGHSFMDLWTSYGTRVFLPFDGTWHAWDLVFIVDPYVWGLLLLAVLAWRRSPVSSGVATVGLGLLLAYVGGRAVLHAQALDLGRVMVPRAPKAIAAIPAPLDPFRWKVIADTGDAYWSGEVHLRQARSPRLERREKPPEDAWVLAARTESDVAATFLSFSRFPLWEVDETAEGRSVSWHDLRFEDVPGLFSRSSVPRETPFVARVVLDHDRRVLSESLRF